MDIVGVGKLFLLQYLQSKHVLRVGPKPGAILKGGEKHLAEVAGAEH